MSCIPPEINYKQLANNVRKLQQGERFDRRDGLTYTMLMMINGLLLAREQILYVTHNMFQADNFMRDLTQIMEQQIIDRYVLPCHRSQQRFTVGEGSVKVITVNNDLQHQVYGTRIAHAFVDVNWDCLSNQQAHQLFSALIIVGATADKTYGSAQYIPLSKKE